MISSTSQPVHRQKSQHNSCNHEGGSHNHCYTVKAVVPSAVVHAELMPHTITSPEILMVDFSLQVQSLVKKGPQQMMAEMVSKLKRYLASSHNSRAVPHSCLSSSPVMTTACDLG
jgi:hypothetical protein